MSDHSTGNPTNVAVIDTEINKIVALAHTGMPADAAEYERQQPRLQELLSSKVGGGVAARAAAPTNIAAYPALPQSQAFSNSDHRDWNAALPEMLALGLSVDQVMGLARIMTRTAEKAQDELEAELRTAHADTQARASEVLQRRFGSNWRERAADAETLLRSALRHDRGVKIGNWTLANGERLGDRPEFVSMIIELAEGRL